MNGNIRNNPWPDTAAKIGESGQLRNVSEVGPDGSIDEKLLKEMSGFELGSTVMLKKQERDTPSLVYHITRICETITLIAADGQARVVSLRQLVDLFRLVEVRYDIVARSADFKKLEEHPDAKQDLIRSTARGVLGDIFRLHQPNVHVDLKLTAKGKHVFAAQNYAKGGLKNVPYSQNIFSAAAKGTKSDKNPLAHICE